MSVILQCTAIFGSDEGRGWAEKHELLLADPPGNLLFYMQQFKQGMDDFRRPMLAKDCRLEAIRVSYPTITGDIASSPFKYSPYLYPANQKVGAAPSNSAKMRMSEATNTHFSDIHLRGFWRDVIVNEQLDFTTAAGTAWKDAADQFNAWLVAQNYGWSGINPDLTRRGNVTNYVQNADKTVTFTVEITKGPPFDEGDLQPRPVRFAKINGGKSAMNREFTVKVSSATTLTTVKQVAALPYQSQGTFVMEAVQFYQYTGTQYIILGKRSMGRPIGRSPSRSKVRPLG